MQWLIFTRKEGREVWRTKKLALVVSLFLIIGILSPLTAKLTPMILAQTLGKEVAANMPQPTSVDSWAQFTKNLTQIGIYLFALLFSQLIQQERLTHQLTPLVIRGLSRTAIIFSKWTMVCLIWLGAILLSFGITWGYTAFYFPDQLSPHPWSGVIGFLLFGFFLSSVLVCSATLATQSFGGVLGVVITMVVLYVIQLFDHVARYAPLALLTTSADLLTGKASLDVLFWPTLSSFAIASGLLFSAITILKKQKV